MNHHSCLKNVLLAWLLALAAALPAQGINELDPSRLDATLQELDHEVGIRERYVAVRRSVIDRLKKMPKPHHEVTPAERVEQMLDMGEAYTAFQNDSALLYYSRAYEGARHAGIDSLATIAQLRLISLMPLAGFVNPAIDRLNAIDTTGFGDGLRAVYHDSARQLYSYLSMVRTLSPAMTNEYSRLATAHQDTLLTLLPKEHPDYRLNLAENDFNHGNLTRAQVLADKLLAMTQPDTREFARAAFLRGQIAEARGESEALPYYWALSAIADIRTATLEVSSLPALGMEIFDRGDTERAYHYLNSALESAVESGAQMRIVQSSRLLAAIQEANNGRLEKEQRLTRVVFIVMLFVLVGLIAALLLLRREMKRISTLRDNLETANRAKEAYISRFLQLCSIYMDKLNQFCQLANRKLSAGKADELYKLTKSGKFIEEQSSDFFEVLDKAFLHIYPDFPRQVNALMREGEKLPMPVDGVLSTDMRILALMRMGITESPRIAEMLNYSLNTIYAYRNKLKNRAIDRENFENNIIKLE